MKDRWPQGWLTSRNGIHVPFSAPAIYVPKNKSTKKEPQVLRTSNYKLRKRKYGRATTKISN